MNGNNNFQQQRKILVDTINLRNKIISLNEDVKKTQEEIKDKIYKMLNFKKNSIKLNLNYLKEFAKKREEAKQIEIAKEKKLKTEDNNIKKSYQKISSINLATNKEKIFENLLFLKNSISESKLDEFYFFTDEEETWIPGLKEKNKEQPLNESNNKDVHFYDWIHKKG